MTKNKIQDLTNHLFATLEALDGTDKDGKKMSEEEMRLEIERARAVVGVSDAILRVADTTLRATALYASHGSVVGGHLQASGILTKAPSDGSQ